ncbi:MAG: PAS domain-containing protein, partial [Myxococcaceae bacterium]
MIPRRRASALGGRYNFQRAVVEGAFLNAGIRPEHQGFEQLPVPVAIAQGEGLVYANPALAQLLGAERGALLAWRTTDLLSRFVNRTDQGWIDPLRSPSEGLARGAGHGADPGQRRHHRAVRPPGGRRARQRA